MWKLGLIYFIKIFLFGKKTHLYYDWRSSLQGCHASQKWRDFHRFGVSVKRPFSCRDHLYVILWKNMEKGLFSYSSSESQLIGAGWVVSTGKPWVLAFRLTPNATWRAEVRFAIIGPIDIHSTLIIICKGIRLFWMSELSTQSYQKTPNNVYLLRVQSQLHVNLYIFSAYIQHTVPVWKQSMLHTQLVKTWQERSIILTCGLSGCG